jgi:hypothetical protein
MKLGQKLTIQSRMVRRNDWRHIGGEKFIPVFFVVESMNRAPFYVLASDLEPKAMP